MNKTQAGWIFAAVLAIGILGWELTPSGPVALRGSGDTLTVAATGDSLLLKPMQGSEDVQTLLRGASLAVTNLDENLLDTARVPRPENPGEIRWPYGTKQTAKELRRAGFSVLSLANNHAIDYRIEGLKQTIQILDGAGLLHAGAGDDLAEARAPVFIGTSPRRVAMLAVATSASSESRATPSRGEIMGRPGVNALKYAPDVTVDSSTFAALKQLPASAAASKADSNQLVVSGKTIKRGDKTAVEILADERDAKEILEQVKQARASAEIVLLAVHSHEPSNQSLAPASFLQQFARSAIDAGASLVIGQGPHQLRGIEVYKTGVILYSLGNFIFDIGAVDPRSEDDYDAGIDLYRLALGAVADSETPPPQSLDNPVWWESVIAVASFKRGVLRSIRLQPIDLGVDLPAAQRGTPRIASPTRGKKILDRLAELSRAFGTQIRIENGIGMVVVKE